MSQRAWQTCVSSPIAKAVSCAFAAVLPSLIPAFAKAEECRATPPQAQALFEGTVALLGREEQAVDIADLHDRTILVSVIEQGVDVQLQLKAPGGAGDLVSDNPAARNGIQRLVTTADPGGLRVVVRNKDGRTVNGSVKIVVEPVDTLPKQCAAVMRHLDVADRAYAIGEIESRRSSGNATPKGAESYSASADAYRSALRVADSAGFLELSAQTGYSLATALYLGLDNWEESERMASRAVDTYERSGDRYGAMRAAALRAAALMEVATGRTSTTAPQESIEVLMARARYWLAEAAAFHASRGELYEQALAQNNIGLSYHYEGMLDTAIEAYRAALPLYRNLRDRTRESQVLQNIALAQYELGRFDDAREGYSKVLQLIEADKNPKLQAEILNNSGLLNRALGNLDVALAQHTEALRIFTATGDTREQAWALHNLGLVYYATGDRDLALKYFQNALAIRTPALDARGRTATLRAVATIARETGQADRALLLHSEALKLATSPRMRGRILVEIARDQLNLGRDSEAIEGLRAVAAPPSEFDELSKAAARFELGRYMVRQGRYQEARQLLSQALQLFEKYEFAADEVEVRLEIARLDRAEGRHEQAIGEADRAIALSEQVRLQSANPELRASLQTVARRAFDLKLALLMDEQRAHGGPKSIEVKSRYAQESLLTAERARAQTLRDYRVLRSNQTDESAGERQRLLEQLAARRYQLASRADRSGVSDPRSRAMQAEIAVLRGKLSSLDASVAGKPHPLGSIEASQRDQLATQPGTAVIEYWIGDARAWAWVIADGRVAWFELASSPAIVRAALEFHRTLSSFSTIPASARINASAALYQLVVAPLGDAIKNHRRLLFAPDGVLHYVPFAALVDSQPSGSALIARHDIASIPAFELRPRGEEPASMAAGGSLLVIADPVFESSDPRLAAVPLRPVDPRGTSDAASLLRTAPAIGPHRLPATSREADLIVAALPSVTAVRLEGIAATREAFLSSDLPQYRFIHIASHATVDAEIPQLSAILLSRYDSRGRTVADRIFAGDLLKFRLNADVFVLSGCETALGKAAAGEGLMGLSYTVLARGARSVVASLWPVPDASTAMLMKEFYASLSTGAGPVAALSGAMRSRARASADPVYWGGFSVLISDERWGAGPSEIETITPTNKGDAR